MFKNIFYKIDFLKLFEYKIKKISIKKCIKKQYNLNYCFISFYSNSLKKNILTSIDNIYYCNLSLYKELTNKLNKNQKIIILNNIHDCSEVYRYYWENNFNVLVLRN